MPAWIPNTVGLLGMLLLAYPALVVNAAARRLARLEEVGFGADADDFFHELQEVIEENGRRRAMRWNPWHQGCLFGGYGLLLLSYMLRYF